MHYGNVKKKKEKQNKNKSTHDRNRVKSFAVTHQQKVEQLRRGAQMARGAKSCAVLSSPSRLRAARRRTRPMWKCAV